MDSGARPYAIGMLGVGESVDHALYLLRDNGRIVLAAVILYTIPTQLLCDWGGAVFTGSILGGDADAFDGVLPAVVYGLWYAVVEGAVVATLFEAAFCVYLGHRYLGTPVTMRSAVRRVASRAWVLIPVHMLFYPLFIAGYAFCMIPGIALYSLFFLRIPAMTLEGQGPFRAMSRAVTLFPSAWAAILCAMLLMTGGQLIFGGWEGLTPFPIIDSALNAAVLGLVQSFEVALTVVLYFSARSRREHIDLDLLAQRVDSVDSTAPVL